MRSKQALKNVVMALALQAFTLVMGFIMPRWIISVFGSEVNGLTSTIHSLLNIIQLLQAGAIGAATYEMFKPVSEKDYASVSRILYASDRYNRRIGYAFLAIAVAVIPYFLWSHGDSGIEPLYMALGFIILAVHSSFSFFFTAHYDVLFSSHQLVSLVSIGNFVEKVVYYGLYVIVLYFELSFLFLYVAILVGGVVKLILFEIFFRRKFKSLLTKPDKKDPYRVKSTRKMFLLQISITIINSSTTLIISQFYGLTAASVYAVYALVNQTVLMLLSMTKGAVSPGMGNVVASESDAKASAIFQNVHYIVFAMGLFIFTCMAALYMPFIGLYTKGLKDAAVYVVPELVVFVMLNSIGNCLSMPYFMMTEAMGLFKKSYKFEVPLALVSVGISALCGWLWSMPSVLLGPSVFYFGSFVYLAVLLKKHKPTFNYGYVFRRTLLMIGLPAFAYILQAYILRFQPNRWLIWIIAGFVVAFASAAILIVYSLIFERKDFENTLQYFRRMLRKTKAEPAPAAEEASHE